MQPARGNAQALAFLARNVLPATAFCSIPGNRLIELGAQVET